MNCVRPKPPRLRLDPELYEQLRNQVLRRDGWRCQACGTMSKNGFRSSEPRWKVSPRRSNDWLPGFVPCQALVADAPRAK